MHWKARIDGKNKYRGYPTNNIGMYGYVDLGVRTQMDGGAAQSNPFIYITSKAIVNCKIDVSLIRAFWLWPPQLDLRPGYFYHSRNTVFNSYYIP